MITFERSRLQSNTLFDNEQGVKVPLVPPCIVVLNSVGEEIFEISEYNRSVVRDRRWAAVSGGCMRLLEGQGENGTGMDKCDMSKYSNGVIMQLSICTPASDANEDRN